ncbi:hypothetical protein [Tenacibaculum aiptasiae]|uniref:hypothetical protein n=1 Tax=Tenacibaculum aiptasiae TaxID=426481 RepID=UPI00232C3BAC|nr:hypothetical protein [Tenacibaculum aiptasiae]
MARYYVILLLIFMSSCSEEYKMKRDFKEAYSEIMKDPDSYELISFDVFQKAYDYSSKNKNFLFNYKKLEKYEFNNYQKVYDSIYDLETKRNPKFGYTGVLVKIRGTNSYGARVTSEHIAYYSNVDFGGRLKEIDGNFVFDNKINRR